MRRLSSYGDEAERERSARYETSGSWTTLTHEDRTFDVPFEHRLRFTRNLWERETNVLAALLEPDGRRPARAQFWIDEGVAETHPELKQRIFAMVERHAPSLELAGPVQIVPGGETIKNDVHILERVLKCMHAAQLDRRSYVVVVGGGAVLDAIGFAAAIAHRGLRLVRVPSTTLAQADSAVGVKNGINLFHKKNWLGAFDVPWAVIADETLLETLSDRDFRSGFSEAVKVALLKDARFFEQLVDDADEIAMRSPEAVRRAIRQSARWHRDHIVHGGDPFEREQARPLDFGHWSAHRLEAMTQFELRHGEAVAIGVAIDTWYSHLVHGLDEATAQATFDCLVRLGFTLDHPALDDRNALYEGLEEFRQHLGGELTLTMIAEAGKSVEIHQVDLDQMDRAIDQVCGTSRARRGAGAP